MTGLTTNDLFSVRGKVALVTGGSRGIGEMIAAGFLANGATVYISSRKASVCDATAVRLAEEHGGTCVSLPADLSTLAGVDALAGALRDREERLDVLVNNAGASWGAPIDDFPENGWDKVMDTNVKGVFFLTQRLLPLLEAGATPEVPARVVNIGSIDGIRTPVFENFSYGPSKAAVHALTRQLAATLVKRNVLVNAIAPGPIVPPPDMTPEEIAEVAKATPLGRWGRESEIARAVLFLCETEFVTGETIRVDGGRHLE